MKFTVLLFCAGLSFSAYAQPKKDADKGTFLVTRGIGVSFQKFDGLNSRVANYPQYKGLRDYMGVISLGSMQVHRNFISGLTLTGGSSMSGDRDKKSSTLRFLGADINLGYDVLPSEKFMLYPLVGVGYEYYRAKYYKDNSTVNFNDVLTSSTVQNNIRPVNFDNGFFTYHAGLGFTVKPAGQTSSFGIQAKYTGSFKDKAWKSSDNQTLANAPVDNLSRVEITLVINSIGKMMK